jgi:Fur family ferric uptake transcriptional regulator
MKQDFKKILREAGLKSTSPRLAVLKILSEIKKPITAQELFKKLKKSDMDLVTLYRTLASFEEKGLLRRVDLQKDVIYYELNDEHHHHIVCTNCNKIEDFENREVERVLEKIAKKSVNFGNIKNHSLELFGLCRECK